MLRDKNENESPELHCKFKSFDQVIESQYFRIMHCVCLQEVDSRVGKDPAENDLVVLICPDEHTTEVFGVIEEIEKTPLREDDGKVMIILLLQSLDEIWMKWRRIISLSSKSAFEFCSKDLESFIVCAPS